MAWLPPARSSTAAVVARFIDVKNHRQQHNMQRSANNTRRRHTCCASLIGYISRKSGQQKLSNKFVGSKKAVLRSVASTPVLAACLGRKKYSSHGEPIYRPTNKGL